MSDDLDIRRRRAAYRATYRGTKEMDWLLGRYAGARLAAMTDPALSLFEKLLTVPDPDLHAWILAPATMTQCESSGLIDDVRGFHGLADNGASA